MPYGMPNLLIRNPQDILCESDPARAVILAIATGPFA